MASVVNVHYSLDSANDRKAKRLQNEVKWNVIPKSLTALALGRDPLIAWKGRIVSFCIS